MRTYQHTNSPAALSLTQATGRAAAGCSCIGRLLREVDALSGGPPVGLLAAADLLLPRDGPPVLALAGRQVHARLHMLQLDLRPGTCFMARMWTCRKVAPRTTYTCLLPQAGVGRAARRMARGAYDGCAGRDLCCTRGACPRAGSVHLTKVFSLCHPQTTSWDSTTKLCRAPSAT